MLTVRLHGHLEEKFGSEFQFDASNIREVIDALQANFDDFTEEFIKDERAYNILVDYEMQDIRGCVLPVRRDSVIDIVPVILGAGNLFKSLALIIIGAVLVIATGGAAAALMAGTAGSATGLAGLGVSAMTAVAGVVGQTAAFAIAAGVGAIGLGLALGGVASLLAGPDGPDGSGKESSSLNQVENIVGQGMPIPIGYGRMLIGSIVLSATYTSSYVRKALGFTYSNTDGSWNDLRLSNGREWIKNSNEPEPFQYGTVPSTATGSNSLTLGQKTFTVTSQGHINFNPGVKIRIYNGTNPEASYMAASVIAFSGTVPTATLTVNVFNVVGTGTFSSWNIDALPYRGYTEQQYQEILTYLTGGGVGNLDLDNIEVFLSGYQFTQGATVVTTTIVPPVLNGSINNTYFRDIDKQ